MKAVSAIALLLVSSFVYVYVQIHVLVYTLCIILQGITFEGYHEVLAEEGVEVVKDDAMDGDDDIDLMDTSSWAGSDRDYTYDEVIEMHVCVRFSKCVLYNVGIKIIHLCVYG